MLAHALQQPIKGGDGGTRGSRWAMYFFGGSIFGEGPGDATARATGGAGERFSGAGVEKDNISFVKDTYRFTFPAPPSELVAAFKKYYGPTMNAFEAAERSGRAGDLQKELEVLFNSQNKNPSKDATSIPATFLRVTVAVS